MVSTGGRGILERVYSWGSGNFGMKLIDNFRRRVGGFGKMGGLVGIEAVCERKNCRRHHGYLRKVEWEKMEVEFGKEGGALHAWFKRARVGEMGRSRTWGNGKLNRQQGALWRNSDCFRSKNLGKQGG